jgi:hypothetical protein
MKASEELMNYISRNKVPVGVWSCHCGQWFLSERGGATEKCGCGRVWRYKANSWKLPIEVGSGKYDADGYEVKRTP